MSVEIETPSPEEKQRLLDEHAHRHPRSARIAVVGDRGARLELPVLVGIPTGAVPPEHHGDRRPSSVWRELVASMLNGAPVTTLSERFAADCLLYPSTRNFSAWCERWPGLASNIAAGALRFIGASADAIVEPDPNEGMPAAIAHALDEHPRSVWRRLVAPGARYDVAIDPLDSVAYDALADALRRGEADPVVMAHDIARGRLRVAVDGKGDKVLHPFARHPGFAVRVAMHARALAGAQENLALGEW